LRETSLATWLLSEIEKAHFTRYFNRAVLISAIVFIWPFLRWVRMDRSLLPAWRPFSTGIKQWALGFALASGLLLALGFVFFKLGAYQLHSSATVVQIGRTHHRSARRWHRRGILFSAACCSACCCAACPHAPR
jgi:hypothetical protein